MSDNRKYYYLKLKESYFDDDATVRSRKKSLMTGSFPAVIWCLATNLTLPS